ncbi:MAG: glycosyltransferase family 2 protein [Lachnospiraceae bacterium]|nr:glycosyltransferase family 2 protein [Lachnospiraceae bacterium]
MKISIIVPCYNEEGNVLRFYEVLKQELSSILDKIELIFVNDGSRDGTGQKLHEIADRNELPVKTIHFSRNFGKEAALRAGLDHADGDYISIIDADLQQRPKYILDMLNILWADERYDAVACYQGERRETKTLSFFKDSFYKMINAVSEVELYRSASDFRTFKRSVRDAICSMSEKQRFSKGIFAWVGFKTYYMEYQVEDRFEGETKWSFTKLFKYALDGIFAFSTFPLNCICLVGMFGGAIGAIWLLALLILWAVTGKAVSVVCLILAALVFLTSTQLFFTGLLGQYLSRMYVEIKDRPMYIMKEYYHNEDRLEQ